MSLIYIYFYNISLIVVFFIILISGFSFIKTMNSFNLLQNKSFFLVSLVITFFSMAGIPPFVGFFTKLLLLTFLINSSMFYLIFFFFLIIFVSLFFYLQNVKYLLFPRMNSNYLGRFNYFFNSNFVVSFILFLNFLLVFGVIILDDVVLIFYSLFI